MAKQDWQNKRFSVANFQGEPAATDNYIPSGRKGVIG